MQHQNDFLLMVILQKENTLTILSKVKANTKPFRDLLVILRDSLEVPLQENREEKVRSASVGTLPQNADAFAILDRNNVFIFASLNEGHAEEHRRTMYSKLNAYIATH